MADHARPARVRAVAIVAIAAAVHGCSFVLVKGPKPQLRDGNWPSCTEAPILPVVDVGLAGLAVVGAIYAHGRLDEPDGGAFPNNDFLRMQRTFSIIGALLMGASATYGFIQTSRCRAARARVVPPAPGA